MFICGKLISPANNCLFYGISDIIVDTILLRIRIPTDLYCQIRIIPESIFSNTFYTFRNFDGSQGGTIKKCIIPDTGHTVRDRDGCQSIAIRKRMIPDAGYTIRDRDGCQSITIRKRMSPNAGYTIRNFDGR